MFGSFGGAQARGSITFVSQARENADIKARYGLSKNVCAVGNIRSIQKRHMIHNAYLPKMEIDAQTYSVRADGVLLTCQRNICLRRGSDRLGLRCDRRRRQHFGLASGQARQAFLNGKMRGQQVGEYLGREGLAEKHMAHFASVGVLDQGSVAVANFFQGADQSIWITGELNRRGIRQKLALTRLQP